MTDQLLEWVTGVARDVVLLVAGSLLTLFVTWVVSGRERKWARADECRERIYGPLHDELANLRKALEKNLRIGGVTDEYERIKREHILYMIPRKLRQRIIHLYETGITQYESQLIDLAKKYRELMSNEILGKLQPTGTTSGTVVDASSSDVHFLIGLAHWLAEGVVPEHMDKELERAYLSVKAQSKGVLEQTGNEFFQSWKARFRSDPECEEFKGLRDQLLVQVIEIREEIQKDLESQH